MKSKASFIHERGAVGTLCVAFFSLTAFSQQIVPPPSLPVGPTPPNQTSETSNPQGQSPAQSVTPHPEPRPIPSPGTNDLNEEKLLGAEYAPNYCCTLDWNPDNPDRTGQVSKKILPWSRERSDVSRIFGHSANIFQRNNLLPRRQGYNSATEKTEFKATWSTKNEIISIKSVTIRSFFDNDGSLRRKRTISGTCDLVLKQCGHIEKHIRHMKPMHVGRMKQMREVQCIKYSLKEIEFYAFNGQEDTLYDRSYQGAAFFAGNLYLRDISESEITPAVPGPAANNYVAAAIEVLAQDCERQSVNEGNQGNSSHKDPPIIRRQQIKLSINGRTYAAEVAIHDVDLFYYDTPTQTIHIGLPSNRIWGIARYHAGVLNEMATFITDANDGRFDGVMTDASGQPLSPLAAEAFSDRLSADYLAYQRSLIAPNPTSTPRNPLDRYLAPLEQSDRSLTESLLNPRRPNLRHEPHYVDEQNFYNARADVFAEADNLIREGKLDSAYTLFQSKANMLGRSYYCKLLRTYEHYFPEKGQRMQE